MGMASLLIRHLSDETKRALRIRAAEHGRSLSEEAASLIHASVTEKVAEPTRNWVDEMLKGLAAIGAGELEIPPRNIYTTREPPDFSGPEFGE